MTAVESVPALPFERRILEVAPLFLALQDSRPISRVRTPAGDTAWLVLGYENVRALLADHNLGRTHADPERAPRYTNAAVIGAPREGAETERADHSRQRMVMNRSFSIRRMEALRPRIQAIVDELLDGMARQSPPADLHEAFAFPLPALVISELLGVPVEDREAFRTWSQGAGDMTDAAAAQASMEKLDDYIRGLIAQRRAKRGEDVISDLVQARDDEGRLTEDEMVRIASGLLFAGHETTVVQIGLGTLLLLTNPDQREALQRDPGLAPRAVEEIMRFATTSVGLLPRWATADVEVSGVTIQAGELVLVGLPAANRDERVFDNPLRFDITRERNPHVAFGYGPRFCLGAPLARVELQVVFGTLFQRFPGLRLAVPLEEIREKSHLLTGGVERLPVTW
jgi:cytochrome P450